MFSNATEYRSFIPARVIENCVETTNRERERERKTERDEERRCDIQGTSASERDGTNSNTKVLS